MANPLFDRDVEPGPRPKHGEVANYDLPSGVKSDILYFARQGEVERDSIALPIPQGVDTLRFTNRVTSYCNTVGGAGWSRVRNQNGGVLRLWKKAEPTAEKLARA